MLIIILTLIGLNLGVSASQDGWAFTVSKQIIQHTSMEQFNVCLDGEGRAARKQFVFTV